MKEYIITGEYVIKKRTEAKVYISIIKRSIEEVVETVKNLIGDKAKYVRKEDSNTLYIAKKDKSTQLYIRAGNNEDISELYDVFTEIYGE